MKFVIAPFQPTTTSWSPAAKANFWEHIQLTIRVCLTIVMWAVLAIREGWCIEHNHTITSIASSQVSSMLLSGSEDNTMHIWDLRQKQSSVRKLYVCSYVLILDKTTRMLWTRSCSAPPMRTSSSQQAVIKPFDCNHAGVSLRVDMISVPSAVWIHLAVIINMWSRQPSTPPTVRCSLAAIITAQLTFIPFSILSITPSL